MPLITGKLTKKSTDTIDIPQNQDIPNETHTEVSNDTDVQNPPSKHDIRIENIKKARIVLEDKKRVDRERKELERAILDREKGLRKKELEVRNMELDAREKELEEKMKAFKSRDMNVEETPLYQRATPSERPLIRQDFVKAQAYKAPESYFRFV